MYLLGFCFQHTMVDHLWFIIQLYRKVVFVNAIYLTSSQNYFVKHHSDSTHSHSEIDIIRKTRHREYHRTLWWSNLPTVVGNSMDTNREVLLTSLAFSYFCILIFKGKTFSKRFYMRRKCSSCRIQLPISMHHWRLLSIEITHLIHKKVNITISDQSHIYPIRNTKWLLRL